MQTTERKIKTRRRQPDLVRKAGAHRDRKWEIRNARKHKHSQRYVGWEA